MKALRYDGREVRLDDNAPDPAPAPGEALVRVSAAGVSSADAEVAQGRTRFSGVMGRDFVGVVDRANIPDDAPAHLAQRAAQLASRRVVGASSVVCGGCDMCRAGLPAHCRARAVPGVAGRDGCFAERVCMPIGALHPLPDAVTDEAAILASAVARALHAGKLTAVQSATYLSVLGAGPDAVVAAMVLSTLNDATRLLSNSEATLRMCERVHVKHRRADEVGRRQDQDVVIDVTGSSAGLRLALQLARPRALVALAHDIATLLPPGAALTEEPPPRWSRAVDLDALVANEIRLIGAREGTMGEAVDLLASGAIDAAALVTRRVRLDQAAAALVAPRPDEEMKVMLQL